MSVGCKNVFFLYIKTVVAWVAQWIEQWFPKPLVAGSIPAPGMHKARNRKKLQAFLFSGTKATKGTKRTKTIAVAFVAFANKARRFTSRRVAAFGWPPPPDARP